MGTVPFAIICDRENDFTREFDQVVLMDDPACSYMDKLRLYQYSPYDETIFIDADSLVLKDLNEVWADFVEEDDVSCYGTVYSLDSDRAWFTYEGCGKYKSQVRFLLDLHGGICYFRKTERSRVIFEQAIELAREYDRYGFRNFDKPADEPVLAMAMAIHQCRPCQKPMRIIFLPSYRRKLKVNAAGELLLPCKKNGIEIIHFATPNTERFMYRYFVQCLQHGAGSPKIYVATWLRCFPKECKAELRHGAGRILRKLMPDTIVTLLKDKVK